MFNVDWDLLADNLLPWYKRKPRIKGLLHVMFQPLKELHGQFLTFRDDTLYRLSITSQVIYLEKLLNDRFNGGSPARGASNTVGLYDGAPVGIHITLPSSYILPNYIWNKAEQRPKTYLYNKWRNNINYTAGEFSVYGSYVWKALQNNTNKQPDNNPADWVQHADRLYMRNKVEFDTYDFVVNIPTAVGLVTDAAFAAKVTAEINEYLIAGPSFQLVNY